MKDPHRTAGPGKWQRYRSEALITPALFSHRTPPDREKREKSKIAPTRFPSPGWGECGGRGDRGEGLGGAALALGR